MKVRGIIGSIISCFKYVNGGIGCTPLLIAGLVVMGTLLFTFYRRKKVIINEPD